MINGRVGSSTLKDAHMAGAEAAREVKGLGTIKPKIAFIYSSSKYNQSELLAAVAGEMKGVPLIGSTSYSGVMTPDGLIQGEDGFVSILAIEGDLKVAVAAKAKTANSGSRVVGQEAAKAALSTGGKKSNNEYVTPDFAYVVATPGEEEGYLDGIADIVGRIPVFGGTAVDDSMTRDGSLFADQVSVTDGVAVAFFYTDEPFANVFSHPYKATENVAIVTKTKNQRTIDEIDGSPIMKKYSKWRKIRESKLSGGNVLAESITHPFGVKNGTNEMIAIKHPINAGSDHSLEFASNVTENTALIMMEASVEDLVESGPKSIATLKERIGHTPKVLIMNYDASRKAVVGNKIDEVYDRIKEEAGTTPFIVPFTFGEIGFEGNGGNTFGNLMLSFAGIG